MFRIWNNCGAFLRRLRARRSTVAPSGGGSSAEPVAAPVAVAALIDVKGVDGVVLLHLTAQTEPSRVWATMPTGQARALCWALWRACRESELPAQVA